ncbi:MAG TPA: DUF3096 domain-containing protein [Candidatus Peribacteraceae bacterium]|nr:DUF3096 domain-containing protein [Candidatus Peribacteraceae bacterium]
MFFFFRRPQGLSTTGSRIIGTSFLSGGILALAFGIAILIAPDLLAYLVAIFFIVMGLSLIGTWWNLRP